MKTVIKNIAELIQTEKTARKWVAGSDMKSISTIKDAFLEIEEGIITNFGSMDSWIGIKDWNNTEVIDAEGGMVFPTYCDSHTHLIFAASREGEFADRINGLSYQEIAKDELVDEASFCELVDIFKGTYFETIYTELTARYPIGRVRILEKDSFNCNSWHRDPEPRLHIPIYTNPGSLFIVNHHCTHLPADGSVYFTDTRGYHIALNGGDKPRTHLVATLAYPEYQP